VSFSICQFIDQQDTVVGKILINLNKIESIAECGAYTKVSFLSDSFCIKESIQDVLDASFDLK
jgi:hypothetical protein